MQACRNKKARKNPNINNLLSHSVVESHIVAWALPKEEIPFRVTWSGPLEFDRIEVEVPDDMEIKELVNVGRHKIIGKIAEIYEVKQAKDVPNYFGSVVSSKGIYDELKVSKPIHVRFYKLSEIVHQVQLEARIFRPLLEVIEAPDKIVLVEGKRQELPLIMRYIGFGDIKIAIEGTLRGRLVTRGRSFIYELLKRLAKVGLIVDENTRKELRDRVSISPEFVKKTTQEILGILQQPPEEIEEMVQELRKMLAEESVKQAIEEILYARVEDMVLSMVIDLLDRHPVDNVRLAYGETAVEAVLQAPVETLELHVHYSDVLNNLYPEISMPIRIESKMSPGKEAMIEIPIKIQRWEHEPFLNVKEMPIGTS